MSESDNMFCFSYSLKLNVVILPVNPRFSQLQLKRNLTYMFYLGIKIPTSLLGLWEFLNILI